MAKTLYNNSKAKDWIVILSFTIPMISRWLLPSGIEESLVIQSKWFPIYSPNILLIIFMLSGERTRCNHLHSLKLVFIAQLIIQFISWLLNDYDSKFAYLFFSNYYLLAIYFALYYHFTSRQIHYLNIILFLIFIILSFEVYLYSSGVYLYSLDLTNNSSFAGYGRISTTIGAATGSAVILFILGGILFYLNTSILIRFFILILWVVPLLLLVTRSALLAIGITLFMYSSSKLKSISINKKLRIVLSIVLIIYSLNYIGLFEPIKTRVAIQTENIDSDRGELQKKTLSNLNENNVVFGLGVGNVFQSKELTTNGFTSNYVGAPHNSYIQVLAESGILGLVVFIFFWLTFLTHTYKKHNILQYTLLSLLTIIFNTESIVITDSEYTLPLTVLLILILSNKSNETNIIYSHKL